MKLKFKNILFINFLIISSFSFSENIQNAYFAGGCFWCMEKPFEELDGVSKVISGYAGGIIESPSYKDVASGKTKHRESVKVIYDADIISYDTILDVFWRQINPTDSKGQFVDRGFQYSPAIFYVSKEDENIALASKEKYNSSNIFPEDIIVPIIKYTTFYPAEDYHQDYYKKNSFRYKYYRSRSGRDDYLNEIWNKK